MKKVLHDHFIPHKGNEYKPHILQKTAALFMLVLLVLTFTIANMQALLWTNSDWLLGAILPAVIVDLTNDNRDDSALSDLRRNSTLDRAAQLKAEHMAENEYFAHFAPDGTSPWFFFGQAGYNFIHAGENLAIHFVDSDDVVEAWMDSPTHRANILNDDFTEIGIGVAEGEFNGQKTIFVVQHFGAPQAVAAAPQAEPVVTAEVTTPPSGGDTVAAAEVVTEPVAIPEPQPDPEPVPEPEVVETREPDPVPPVETELESTREPEETASLEIPESTRPAESTGSETEVGTPEVTEVAVAPEPDQTSELTTSTAPIAVGSTDIGAGPDANLTLSVEESPLQALGSFVGRLATSPNTLLQLMYVLIALFVIGALLLSIMIEFQRQHPVQIAYGTGLLAVMGGLFYMHSLLTTGATIV